MKCYWDTSAVINAAISPQVFDRLKEGEHVTRLHTLGEFFAHMTGRGVRYKDSETGEEVFLYFTPNECAEWLRAFAERINFVELTRDEVLRGLDKAQSKNIQGARVYDYWHALVSEKTNADGLLTRNLEDFKDLVPKLEWP